MMKPATVSEDLVDSPEFAAILVAPAGRYNVVRPPCGHPFKGRYITLEAARAACNRVTGFAYVWDYEAKMIVYRNTEWQD